MRNPIASWFCSRKSKLQRVQSAPGNSSFILSWLYQILTVNSSQADMRGRGGTTSFPSQENQKLCEIPLLRTLAPHPPLYECSRAVHYSVCLLQFQNVCTGSIPVAFSFSAYWAGQGETYGGYQHDVHIRLVLCYSNPQHQQWQHQPSNGGTDHTVFAKPPRDQIQQCQGDRKNGKVARVLLPYVGASIHGWWQNRRCIHTKPLFYLLSRSSTLYLSFSRLIPHRFALFSASPTYLKFFSYQTTGSFSLIWKGMPWTSVQRGHQIEVNQLTQSTKYHYSGHMSRHQEHKLGISQFQRDLRLGHS